MKMTTSGRLWAYVGTMIGLGASLAGNIAAASLHNAEPNEIDYALAGVAPAAVFLAIEIGSRNPWEHTLWGPTLRKIAMWIVGPAAAIFSFIHLVELSLDGKQTVVWDGRFHILALVNWIAAILVPLMIDGLMVISAAALLLPAQRTTVIEHGFRGHALPAPASTAALEALAQRLAEAERAVVMQADEIARLAAAKRRPRPEPAAPPPSDVPTAHQQWLAHRAQHGAEPDMEKVRGWLLAEGRTLEPNSVRAQMSRWRNPKVSTSA